MRLSRLISLVAALGISGAAALAGAPERVVSLNVCTDQLAMMLAAPGQLVSVSALADDPRVSAMADAARAVPANDGSAEAVVRLRPDLVLAGTWTTRATVEMLRRLGNRVELFAPVTSLSEARASILRMGTLLDREAKAHAVIGRFDARLADLRATPGKRPKTALYYALGTTAGPETLPGDLLRAAGMDNIAEARGLPVGGRLSLEELILSDLDLVLVAKPYPGHARATELLQHPALRASGKLRVIENGAAWSCETPHLLDALADLVELRRDWEASQ